MLLILLICILAYGVCGVVYVLRPEPEEIKPKGAVVINLENTEQINQTPWGCNGETKRLLDIGHDVMFVGGDGDRCCKDMGEADQEVGLLAVCDPPGLFCYWVERGER
jgi:hypothetical protein